MEEAFEVCDVAGEDIYSLGIPIRETLRTLKRKANE